MHIIRTISFLAAILLGTLLTGCSDPVPTDYTEEVVLEGFVLVGQPLSDIRIYRSLPITDTFRIKNAMIHDADFLVMANDNEIAMEFVDDSLGGAYQAVDTTYRVLPEVTYRATVRTRGKVLTGTTTTPPVFNWRVPPKDTFIYPGLDNETQRYDSLDIFWGSVPGVRRYVLSIQCLDTLGYGRYLTPQTDDMNKRLREEDRFDDGTLISNERTRYGPAFQPNTPTVWSAFKWYGKHEIRVYAPDKAFNDWFSMVGFGRRSQYDYRLGNVKGGLGIWGSASLVKYNSFLKKNKP